MRLRKDGRPWSPMWDEWTLEQEGWLRAHAGERPIEELAAAISAEFGVERSVASLRIRAKKMSVSLWVRGWSMRDVSRLFRVGHRGIRRWWVEPGLLHGHAWLGRGPHLGWWFNEADVECFIRTCPWAYDATRMMPGHRLTQLAALIQRADPWLTRIDLAQYLGYRSITPLKRAMRRGLIPHQRRYVSLGSGAGGQGEIRIRASDFPEIREQLGILRLQNKRAGDDVRELRPAA